LRNLTRRRGLLDLGAAGRRMPSSFVRLYEPADFEPCLELYRLNEPGRFPEGVIPQFEKSLREDRVLRLVIEEAGTVVGCGSIHLVRDPQVEYAYLSFGLIHPHCQGRGLGSVLLLARLAVLPFHISLAGLQAVPASRSFYESYGFRQRGVSKVGDYECALCFATVGPDDIEYCGKLLRRCGVKMPRGELAVPEVVYEG